MATRSIVNVPAWLSVNLNDKVMILNALKYPFYVGLISYCNIRVTLKKVRFSRMYGDVLAVCRMRMVLGNAVSTGFLPAFFTRTVSLQKVFFMSITVFFFVVSVISAAFAQSTQPALSNELSAEVAVQHGDVTVDDALRRVTGITYSATGLLNPRALGLRYFSVAVDGQRLAGTGFGERGFDLQTLPVELFRDFEYLWFLRANQDANALSGTINLKTGSDGLASQRYLRARLGAGSNADYYRMTGTTGNVSIQYTEPLLESLTLHLNIVAQQDANGWEGFATEYAVRDFGSGLTDVVQRFTPGIETTVNERLGGNLQLYFQPDERQRYYLRAFANVNNREFVRHEAQWFANNSWVNPTTTGNLARHFYNLDTYTRSVQLYAAHAGGRYRFSAVELDYKAGWSHANVNQSRYLFGFEAFNMPHTIDLDDRSRPVVEPVNNMPTRQTLRLTPMNYIKDRHLDTRLHAQADATVNLAPARVQFGAGFQRERKDANDAGAFLHVIFNSRVPQTLNDFDEMRVRTVSVLGDTYTIPWLSDAASARNFLDSSVPAFATNDQTNRMLTDRFNYGSDEDVISAYAMTDVTFGPVNLYVGVRLEHTIAAYDGRQVRFDRFNRFVSTTEVTDKHDYTTILPSFMAGYNANETLSLSLSYGRTIHRHDYLMLAPFQMIAGSDTTLFSGNPSLKPLQSDNIDLRAQFTPIAVTRIQLGAFYKAIQNYAEVGRQRVRFAEGQEPVFDYLFENNPGLTSVEAMVSQYRNSDATASVYGFDAGVQQQFDFLPGLLRYLSAGVTYTYTFSELNDVRQNSVVLQNYSPHTLYAILSMHSPKWYVNVSYHRASEVLIHMSDEVRLAPSINTAEPVFFDQYSDGWSDLSVAAGVNLSPRFTLWINALNLLGAEQRLYHEDRSLYPSGAQKMIGRGVMAGIQFQL
jgi:TonB-dependent receptor